VAHHCVAIDPEALRQSTNLVTSQPAGNQGIDLNLTQSAAGPTVQTNRWFISFLVGLPRLAPP
jgi:hypothetical protein